VDQLIINMPEDKLKEYVINNFAQLTDAELLLVGEKIDELPSSLLEENIGVISNPAALILLFNKCVITPAIIKKIIDDSIDIPYDVIKGSDELRNNYNFMNYAFKRNPKVFLLYPASLMNYFTANEALNKDVIATEEDIIFNPVLGDCAPIMTISIKKDPKLIKYITAFCGIQISSSIIHEALEKYELTKEDMINNPELGDLYSITSKLPNLYFYSRLLSDEEKIEEITRLLELEDYEQISELPFFMQEFDGKVSSENVKWFIEFLLKNFNKDEDYDQKYYFKILDNIINGIVENRYQKNKTNFAFSDVGAIASTLNANINTFSNIDDALKSFALKVLSFINIDVNNKFVNEDYMISRVFSIKDGLLNNRDEEYDKNLTLLCNEILNLHRNYYMSLQKKEILDSLKEKIKLSDKKLLSFHNGKKLLKITYNLALKNYNELKITEEELKERIDKVENDIRCNKDVLKFYGQIDDKLFGYLRALFLNSGQIDIVTVNNLLGIDNLEIAQYIVKKYESIKVEILDNVVMCEEELNISYDKYAKLDLNYFNFKIASLDIFRDNLSRFLLSISDDDIFAIRENNTRVDKTILDLLYYIYLIPDFDEKDFVNILVNYNKIKQKLFGNINDVSSIDLTFMFNNIIKLANGYAKNSDLYSYVLGENACSKIEEEHRKDYFDVYLKMLKRLQCNIPAVSGEFNNQYYESGNFRDIERLTIGKGNNNITCIDLLNIAGSKTYFECLTEKNGDIIMLRDKKTGEYVARALVFRAGNIIQIGAVYDINGIKLEYDVEFYKKIADEIMEKAIKSNDNIDYVFVTNHAIKDTKYPVYFNRNFEAAFPHADFYNYACLLSVNPGIKDVSVEDNLSFYKNVRMSYKKERKNIVASQSEDYINQLNALNIIINYPEKIHSGEFQPIFKEDYKKIISGEDWYIAIRNDDSIESVLLPFGDKRAIEEFEIAKNSLGIIEEFTR